MGKRRKDIDGLVIRQATPSEPSDTEEPTHTVNIRNTRLELGEHGELKTRTSYLPTQASPSKHTRPSSPQTAFNDTFIPDSNTGDDDDGLDPAYHDHIADITLVGKTRRRTLASVSELARYKCTLLNSRPSGLAHAHLA